jgi:hypothetical protein
LLHVFYNMADLLWGIELQYSLEQGKKPVFIESNILDFEKKRGGGDRTNTMLLVAVRMK